MQIQAIEDIADRLTDWLADGRTEGQTDRLRAFL